MINRSESQLIARDHLNQRSRTKPDRTRKPSRVVPDPQRKKPPEAA